MPYARPAVRGASLTDVADPWWLFFNSDAAGEKVWHDAWWLPVETPTSGLKFCMDASANLT